MVFVDGDCHGDGYVTPTVCLYYNEQTGFVKVHTHYTDFTDTDWSAQQSFA